MRNTLGIYILQYEGKEINDNKPVNLNDLDDNLSSSGSDRDSDADLLELPSDTEVNTTTKKSEFKDGFRPAQGHWHGWDTGTK